MRVFEENRSGVDYVVGDIHGCYDALMDAMERVGFDRQNDRLFSVGDLIDRGPRSLDCLRLVNEPWFHAVRGNHEELASKGLFSPLSRHWRLWLLNGGQWVEGEDIDAVRKALDRALQNMPYALEVKVADKRVGIVHAQPPVDWARIDRASEDELRDMVWSRTRIGAGDDSPVAGIDAVVVGHTIVSSPVRLGNVLYIDTGAFAPRNGGYLTVLPLESVVRKGWSGQWKP